MGASLTGTMPIVSVYAGQPRRVEWKGKADIGWRTHFQKRVDVLDGARGTA